MSLKKRKNEKIFIRLGQTDDSQRSQKAVTVKKILDKLDFIKIKNFSLPETPS